MYAGETVRDVVVRAIAIAISDRSAVADECKMALADGAAGESIDSRALLADAMLTAVECMRVERDTLAGSIGFDVTQP